MIRPGCSSPPHQVEQHEQLMGEFETKYTEFKNHCFEMQHNFFRAVEEHEEGYFNSLAQLAQVPHTHRDRHDANKLVVSRCGTPTAIAAFGI